MDDFLSDFFYNFTFFVPNDATQLRNIKEAHHWLLLIYPNILFIVGLPGNVGSIVVYQRRVLRDSFVSVLLTCLCVSNVLALTFGLLRFWIGGLYDFDIGLVSRFWCLFPGCMAITSVAISNWLTVTLLACRLYFMMNPDKAMQNFTKSRAGGLVVLVLTVTSIPSAYFSAIRIRAIPDTGSSYIIDAPHSPHPSLIACYWTSGFIIDHVHAVFCGLAPIFFVILINFAILRKFKKQPVRRTSLMGSTDEKGRLVTMMVLSDVHMIVMFFPIFLYVIIAPHYLDRGSVLGNEKYHLGYSIVTLNMYSAYAVSWMIYCCTGRRFRAEFYKMFVCQPKRAGVKRRVTPTRRPRKGRRLRKTEQAPMAPKRQSSIYRTQRKQPTPVLTPEVLETGQSSKSNDMGSKSTYSTDSTASDSVQGTWIRGTWIQGTWI